MKLRECIDTDRAYEKAEAEIREWVEKSYPGLSIVFLPPVPEIVHTDPKKNYTPSRVRKITEAVNIKIGSVLERHEEEIYIADLLDRIYKRHPDFADLEVDGIEDIKSNKRFLDYIRELSFDKEEIR